MDNYGKHASPLLRQQSPANRNVYKKKSAGPFAASRIAAAGFLYRCRLPDI